MTIEQEKAYMRAEARQAASSAAAADSVQPPAGSAADEGTPAAAMTIEEELAYLRAEARQAARSAAAADSVQPPAGSAAEADGAAASLRPIVLQPVGVLMEVGCIRRAPYQLSALPISITLALGRAICIDVLA
jgi:hypothetical protein